MAKIDYISYKEKDLINKPLAWQKRGLQETASGYGAKLTSTKMLKVGNKMYRVYIAQYGNSGSPYIIKDGKKLFLRSW
jgi:hypothetical protein